MRPQCFRSRFFAFLLVFTALVASGSVSFSPAGDDQWVQAGINRPLTIGDRVWTDEVLAEKGGEKKQAAQTA